MQPHKLIAPLQTVKGWLQAHTGVFAHPCANARSTSM